MVQLVRTSPASNNLDLRLTELAGYLANSTKLDDSINITIPTGVGPVADYYSIAIADITTGQGPTYSNKFNLTGANGNYSEYENHLGGSPFWSANDLPCTSYNCARGCAMQFYPADLTDVKEYAKMKTCILACDGVTVAPSQTAPAHASSTSSATASSASGTGTATENSAAATSSGAATANDRNVIVAGAVAAGFGALAFIL